MSSGANRPIKLVIVGDGTVGKTCLLISYTNGSFPEGEYCPTVFDNYGEVMECDGVKVSLTLWDTAGQEDYERLRPLSYPKTDAFLVCFSIDNKNSYEHVATKWLPEIHHYCPKTPFILIGTKSDLRVESSPNCVNTSQAKKFSKKVRAIKYVECSAKTMEGVQEVFVEVVRGVLNPAANSGKGRICTVL